MRFPQITTRSDTEMSIIECFSLLYIINGRLKVPCQHLRTTSSWSYPAFETIVTKTEKFHFQHQNLPYEKSRLGVVGGGVGEHLQAIGQGGEDSLQVVLPGRLGGADDGGLHHRFQGTRVLEKRPSARKHGAARHWRAAPAWRAVIPRRSGKPLVRLTGR